MNKMTVIHVTLMLALLLSTACVSVYAGPFKIVADEREYYCESYFTEISERGSITLTMYTCKPPRSDCKIIVAGIKELHVESLAGD